MPDDTGRRASPRPETIVQTPTYSDAVIYDEDIYRPHESHSERSARVAHAESRNRIRPEREAPRPGHPAIPRLRAFGAPLGMTTNFHRHHDHVRRPPAFTAEHVSRAPRSSRAGHARLRYQEGSPRPLGRHHRP